MAMNAREAAKIVDTAAKMKRTLMVGQNFRFNRQTQIAKAALMRGDLGEIYHARCFWLRRSGIPRTVPGLRRRNSPVAVALWILAHTCSMPVCT